MIIVTSERIEAISAPELYFDLLKKCLTRYVFEDGALDQNSGQLVPSTQSYVLKGGTGPRVRKPWLGFADSTTSSSA